ncbi:MAG: lysophospholipid acyltransferase family protein [Thermogutta sp.]
MRLSRTVIDYLVYLVVRTLILIVQAIPLSILASLAKGLAWLFADVLHIRRGVAEENLATAFPGSSPRVIADTIRRMWEHLFLMVFEIAHSSRVIHETNWRRFIHLNEVRPLVKLLLEDRPVILVTGHFGNFELGGYLLGMLGFPTHTVARTLDNRFLDRFVNRFRGATGQFIIPKNGGHRQIEETLERGGTLTLLADQDAGRKGCFVPFFGRPASTYKALALLSLEYDAPLAVVYVKRLGQPLKFEMGMQALLDPRELAGLPPRAAVEHITRWYTSELEAIVRSAPEQYWWIHRRWKTQPKTARESAATGHDAGCPENRAA